MLQSLLPISRYRNPPHALSLRWQPPNRSPTSAQDAANGAGIPGAEPNGAVRALVSGLPRARALACPLSQRAGSPPRASNINLGQCCCASSDRGAARCCMQCQSKNRRIHDFREFGNFVDHKQYIPCIHKAKPESCWKLDSPRSNGLNANAPEQWPQNRLGPWQGSARFAARGRLLARTCSREAFSVCVYTCVYIYIYMHTHVRMYTYVHICIKYT